MRAEPTLFRPRRSLGQLVLMVCVATAAGLAAGGVPMSLATLLNDDIDALVVFLDNGKSAARFLQQRGQFSFDEPFLLVRIAHMTQRRAHVKRAADLALGQNIVAAQVNLGSFAGGLQLF